ncbi:MAG: nucleoside transporter C-terminal domain-containing protein [Candidatus Omnitrophota bacterium]
MDRYNFVSFAGIFILIAVAWLFSSDKKKMNWRVVVWGVVIQLCLALFIFTVPAGTKFFLFLNNFVIKILYSASSGAQFVFGRLALAPGQVNAAGESSLGFILTCQALPTIIFFSALISVLYFLNIMPPIIRGFAYVFTKLTRVSGAEALVSASNIFVGIESALTVRPHLNQATASELCTILTAGMATVASNVLALYVFTLVDQFPTIAGHLISASLLSAPAALVMSKIILPEKGKPLTMGKHIQPHYQKDSSLFEAIINGANSGVKMIVGIVALLIAVLGLVSLIDLFLSGLGSKINLVLGLNIQWSLKGLLGYVFYPFTLIIGIPSSDAGLVSKIIAERVVVTEVVAYQDLAAALRGNLLQSPRSAVITAYALCGFAHLASMAIFVGGISALIPEKVGLITKVAPRALLAATLACLLTACVAGTFFIEGTAVLCGTG